MCGTVATSVQLLTPGECGKGGMRGVGRTRLARVPSGSSRSLFDFCLPLPYSTVGPPELVKQTGLKLDESS
jgi:hypothetical protein